MKNLGLAGFVVVLGCTVAACAGDLEGKKQAPEDTAFAGMALSAECSSCVGDALVLECSAELQQCANDPGCFDVSGCLASCDPNDVQCFSECAQSSLSFQNLSGCAFCGECAEACQADWTCGDVPPTECDPSVDPDCETQCDDPNDPSCGGNVCEQAGSCDECVSCAVDGGACEESLNACMASSDCQVAVSCIQECQTEECVDDCLQQNPDGVGLAVDIYQCVGDACGGSCEQQCDDPNDPSCGGGGGGQCDATGSCQECLNCTAQSGECDQQINECLNDAECQEVFNCFTQCGDDQGCLAQCGEGLNDSPATQWLGECVMTTCGEACSC